MTPERWAQIEELFHRAAQCDTDQRAALLDATCKGDDELRRQVERLLAADASAGRELEAAFRNDLEENSFPHLGETVSHYRIMDAVGGGGMGLVYRAEDLKLGRQVAIKFLPEESAQDPDALGRFEREARSASSLEHPNICPIYQFGEHNGQPFLVMQLLHGKTLRELILERATKSPGFEFPELVDLALQICEGLEAAHQRGIIHRDIKPANIFVTDQGQAKILDFGLAKHASAEEDLDPSGQSRRGPVQQTGDTDSGLRGTPDFLLSRTGKAMGTAGYMSPEQTLGQKLDARTDLFSFGLVLFEMATGRRIHQDGLTPSSAHDGRSDDIRASEVRDSKIPAGLKTLILKSIEPERLKRYQTASALHSELETLKRQFASRKYVRKWITVAAVSAFGLVTTAGVVFQKPPAPRVLRVTRVTDVGNVNTWAYPVSDGSKIYFLQNDGPRRKLMQLSIQGGPIQPAFGGLSDMRIFDVSPDGLRFLLGRFDRNLLDMEVWMIRAEGGTPARVGNVIADYAVWARDGAHIFYAKGSDLLICDADGRNSRKVVSTRGKISRPVVSPDGKIVRFYAYDERISSGTLWEVSTDGGNPHPLFPAAKASRLSGMCCGHWTADGRYFLYESWHGLISNIWALREKRGFFEWRKANPVQLTEGPGFYLDPIPARNGNSVFVSEMNSNSFIWRYDPTHRAMSAVPNSRRLIPFGDPLGKWVLYIDSRDGTLWRGQRGQGEPAQFANPPVLVTEALWSPDGSKILVLGMTPEGESKISILARDGGQFKTVVAGPDQRGKLGWCAGNTTISFTTVSDKNGMTSILLLDLVTQKLQELPASGGLDEGRCSPDGQFVLGLTKDFETLKIYSARLRTWTEVAHGKMISSPTWDPDGMSFYYQDKYEENQPLYRYRIKEKRREKIFDLAEMSKQGYLTGNFYALDPDGAFLFRMHSQLADIYALDLELP